MRLPVHLYPNGGATDGFFMSREAYERMLRGLVRNYSDCIQWVTGTATGLGISKDARDTKDVRAGSVTVRLVSGEEKEILSSLVVGRADHKLNGMLLKS